MIDHTKGPWAIEDDLNLTPGGSLAIVHRDAEGRGTIIAEIFSCDDSWRGSTSTEPIGLANAALVAKAPEMHEALLALVQACDSCEGADALCAEGSDAWEALNDLDDALKQARAALGEADGE